jgi:hypothetical protein
MRRINVVGTSCSGKTTLARELARRLAMPHVEFDALFWGPDWTPVPALEFRERLTAALAAERWVADGGYANVRDITWGRVDTIVWLDYPLRLVLARWARRTVARIRSSEEFWPGTGNRESVRKALRGDGLIWWILRTHHRRRRSFGAAMRGRSDLRWIRLRSPAEADRWLTSVQAVAASPATTAGARASAQNPYPMGDGWNPSTLVASGTPWNRGLASAARSTKRTPPMAPAAARCSPRRRLA